jgi:hypothetical protein
MQNATESLRAADRAIEQAKRSMMDAENAGDEVAWESAYACYRAAVSEWSKVKCSMPETKREAQRRARFNRGWRD